MSYHITVEYDPSDMDNLNGDMPAVLAALDNVSHSQQGAFAGFEVQVFSHEQRSPVSRQLIDSKAEALVLAVMRAGFRAFSVHHSY